MINDGLIIDSDLTNAARVTTLVGVAAEVYARASHDASTTYTGPRRVGVVMSSPNSLLDLSLLTQVSLRTLNNGTVQQTFGLGGLLDLQLLTLFNDPSRFMLIVETTNDFDAVEIAQGATVGLLSALDIYSMCVAPPSL
ncbi:MAG: hypothetical protein NVV73_22495 [Cellvibrionaceae bacterium]|nr:hypothetical protein [Cellvibrionaceae bacterium]